MYAFGKRSSEKLATCDERLQRLMRLAIERSERDFMVVCGHRGQAEQDAAFDAGFSRLKFPKGRHNSSPSLAVDVCPYPVDWNDKAGFNYIAGLVKECAKELEISVVWGGDWADFVDVPHFQVAKQ